MRSFADIFAHLFHPRFSNNHRARLLHPEGFFVLSGVVIIFTLLTQFAPLGSNSTGSILGFSSSITPAKVVELTNAERAKAGLPPLSLNEQLSSAAVSKAVDMFQDQYWAHFSPTGESPWQFITNAGYRYQVAGENLARDFLHTDEMVNAWMNSPTHRDNIVSSEYQEIGVGVVDGVLNGVETTLVVQMFGRRNGVLPVAQINPAPAPSAVPTVPESAIVEADLIQDDTLTQESDNITLPFETISTVQFAQAAPIPAILAPRTDERVLSSSLQRMIEGERPPLLSPLHLSKAFFLAITMMVIGALSYDMMVVDNLRTVRFVGRNLAHIVLFSIVFFLLLLFRGGVIR